MAGLSQAPLRAQLQLIAELRWRMFVNGLRTIRGRVEVLSRVITVVMMSGMVVGGAIGAGLGAFFGVTTGHAWMLIAPLWAVALAWQLYPLVVAASSPAFEFRNLLRFPLRFSSFALLSIGYGMADPAAVAGSIWLTTFAIGLLAARPSLVLPAIPVLALFAMANLLFGRMLLAWLDRWLARRRTREIFAVLFIFFILALQFSGEIVRHWSHAGTIGVAEVLRIQRPLPPGVAGSAIVRATQGAWGSFALWAIAELAYAALFGALLLIRLRAQFRGEDLSEGQARVIVRSAAVAEGWRVPILSSQAAAIVEKEFRYLLRNPPMMLALVMAPLLILVFGVSGGPHEAAGALGRHSGLIFPVAMAYVTFLELNLVYNAFGFDANGISFLLVAPVAFRRVLAGKNTFVVLLMLIEATLVWAGVSWLARPPAPTIVLATLAGMAFVLLVDFAIGNQVSLFAPRRSDFGISRRQQVSGTAAMIGMGVKAVLLGICAAVFAVALLAGRPWLAVVVCGVLAVAAWPAYRWSLARCDRLALEQREVLLAALSRTE